MHGADTPEGYNRVLNTFNTEAGFNSNATGDRGRSVGVGQINFDAHPEYAKLNLRDPYINLGVARDIWNRQGPQNAYKTTWDRLGYSRQ